MTDKEMLIELLYESDLACNKTLCEDCDYLTSNKCKAVMMAEHLISGGMFLESKQATSDENKRWIPVSERLPEDGKVVLVWCKIGKMFIGYRRRLYGDNSYWYILTARDSTKHITYKVTHWMPLPEPPEEEK